MCFAGCPQAVPPVLILHRALLQDATMADMHFGAVRVHLLCAHVLSPQPELEAIFSPFLASMPKVEDLGVYKAPAAVKQLGSMLQAYLLLLACMLLLLSAQAASSLSGTATSWLSKRLRQSDHEESWDVLL